jgi:hypothetical protein
VTRILSNTKFENSFVVIAPLDLAQSSGLLQLEKKTINKSKLIIAFILNYIRVDIR